MNKTIAFTGRRPKDLVGYDYNKYREFVKELTALLATTYGDNTTFITGGAQGFDQLAFWAVNCVKKEHPKWHNIKNVVYVPFKGQESRWAKTGDFSQEDYRKMLRFADEVKYLNDSLSKYSDIVKALHSRNHAMIDDCDKLVALYPSDDWKTSKGGTAEAMRYADSIGKEIMQIRYSVVSGNLHIDTEEEKTREKDYDYDKKL